MAYQSSQTKTNFLTLSEVSSFEDGKWTSDRSQNFYLQTEALNVEYLNVLKIVKKPDENLEKFLFTAYIAGENSYFYRIEFEVAKTADK